MGWIRWPGMVKPGTNFTEMYSAEDWLPTFMAAVGQPKITERLLKGDRIGGKVYKVHLDGYDQSAYLAGRVRQHPSSKTWRTCSTWRFS